MVTIPSAKSVHPSEGGCWYCHTTRPRDLTFCWEFDCYVHRACVKRAVSSNPNDREAAIIASEVLA